MEGIIRNCLDLEDILCFEVHIIFLLKEIVELEAADRHPSFVLCLRAFLKSKFVFEILSIYFDNNIFHKYMNLENDTMLFFANR